MKTRLDLTMLIVAVAGAWARISTREGRSLVDGGCSPAVTHELSYPQRQLSHAGCNARIHRYRADQYRHRATTSLRAR